MPSIRSRFALSLVAFLAFTPAVAAQARPGAPDTSKLVQLAMAISGGASLGSYQSGVTWAMIEFYRRATRDSDYRTLYKLPRFSLASIAGASAGNVNGVLSAIEWCNGGPPRLPEKSLYWAIWVRVGIDQLLATPANLSREEDRGLFRRGFFRDSLYKELERDMTSASAAPCDIPIGITLTRMRADSFVVQQASATSPAIRVPIQRFASVFRLKRDSVSGRTMRFVQAREAVRHDRSLGVLIAPVAESADSIPMDTVLAIVEASSAFPVAFAPRVLRYYPAASLGANGECRERNKGVCTGEQKSQFIDGGVFDNIPMSLTIGMYQGTRPTTSADPLTLVFVDPGLLRGRLDRVRAGHAKEPPATYGLDAVSRVARDALPSARKYEMFTFGRVLSKPVARRDSVLVRPTSRVYPVVGEHLGAFAGFLGRPFREFDFFAGVYDGMYFLTQEHFCLPPEPDPAGCRQATMKRFIAGDHILVSPPSREVLTALFREDFSETIPLDSLKGLEAQRARLMSWLAKANDSLFVRETHCRGAHPVDQFFCRSGFDLILHRFDRDGARTLLKAMRKTCDSLGVARDQCSADDAVIELLDGRERYLNRLNDRMLRQAWEVERFQLGDTAVTSQRSAVKAAHFIYRSMTEHHRRGVDLDPSTIPNAEDGTWWRIFSFLPYYLVGGIGNSSTEGGWRPTYYIGRRYAVIVPVDVAAFDSPGDRHEIFLSSGVGLLVRRQSFGFSGFHLNVSTQLLSEREYRGASFGDRLGAEAVAYLAAGKFRLSIRTLAPSVRPALRGRRWMGSIGAADVNGMLYWIAKR